MIRGRFGDTSGRPYVEGLLVFPRLNIQSHISFLIDTGADRSVLHPADGMLMGLDYGTLSGSVESVGIGGFSKNFEERALLVFTEPGRFLHAYRVPMIIAPPVAEIMGLPSLLGRDVLDRWRMTYHPSAGYLSFKVISADLTLPITQS